MKTPSHNHHGFIITSPSGSVSLKEIPVPVYATRELASKAGKASGKPFVIVEASKFYRTSFGRMVQNFATRKAKAEPRLIVGAPAIAEANKIRQSPLTTLLNRLREKKKTKHLQEKIDHDTRLAHPTKEEIEEHRRRRGDAGKMHIPGILMKAFQPPPAPEEKKLLDYVSDSHLYSIYQQQHSETQKFIDFGAKILKPGNINKLVKSNSITSILILWRAGKLPEKARTRTKLAKILS